MAKIDFFGKKEISDIRGDAVRPGLVAWGIWVGEECCNIQARILLPLSPLSLPGKGG
jgi:hypothetical protein